MRQTEEKRRGKKLRTCLEGSLTESPATAMTFYSSITVFAVGIATHPSTKSRWIIGLNIEAVTHAYTHTHFHTHTHDSNM